MGKSILIYKNSKEKRLEKIREIIGFENFSFENNPDFKLIEKSKTKKSIGIEEVRNLNSFIKVKPISHSKKCIVISEANALTTEAQNSLLKILEESPSYSFIFLESSTIENILPTILSRCEKYQLESSFTENSNNDFVSMTISQRLEFVEEISKLDKEEIVQKLREILVSVKNKETKISPQNLNLLLETIENISRYNINTRLALENLSVNFK